MPSRPEETIERRARFDMIRYANCWEDADLAVAALVPSAGSPVGGRRRVLSIASAGDNSLSLLAADAEVVAVDLSPAQLALVELKVAAIRTLSRDDVLAFLGLGPEPMDGAERRTLFRDLDPELPPSARAFWRDHSAALSRGVVHAGKFERYFGLFRRRVLPWIHRRATVDALLEPRSAEERRRFYEKRWDTWRWRLLFRAFFSRWAMGRFGRDPEFFRHVEGSVAGRILERTRYALTELPVHDNPYVEYILRGGFVETVPPYLKPAAYERVRDGLHRLTLHRGPVEEAAARHGGEGFDGFNLSDIFEYLDAETCRRIYGELLAHARPGARFAYWNMLVPRRRPEELAGRVRSLDRLAGKLFARDRAFFYSAFVVEEAV